jgi:3-oxoacid CoA-transferase subunit B
MTEHLSKRGEPKIVEECTLALTGPACVNLIVTDLAVFDVTENGLVLAEAAGGVSIRELRHCTAAPFQVASHRVGGIAWSGWGFPSPGSGTRAQSRAQSSVQSG